MSAPQNILSFLNASAAEARLGHLAELIKQQKSTEINTEFENINNHIHTIYSFSPYSPTAAVWFAKEAGLSTAGIMDHDSVSGCREFIEKNGQ